MCKIKVNLNQKRDKNSFLNTNIKFSRKTNPCSILVMYFRRCFNQSKFGQLLRRWKKRLGGWGKHFPIAIICCTSPSFYGVNFQNTYFYYRKDNSIKSG